jgi:hypothetical protein
MHDATMRMLARGLGLLLAVGLLAGCRSRQLATPGTSVGPCDTLQGRLPPGRCGQSFTFEGVESSLLDFDLRSDCGNVAAPQVQLFDPEGNEVPVAAQTMTAEGAATTRVRDVVLLRSGSYQVKVVPQTCEEVYYTFSHRLQFPGIQDMRLNLTSCRNQPVTISAPRGGQVTVQIRPWGSGGARVQVNGVEDPWGGRALDPSRRLEGAPPPMVHHGDDGSYYLNFNAPIPGRYTILAAAKPGGDGPAVVSAVVRQPSSPARRVLHPNTAPDGYGVPAASGSMSDTSSR